MLHTVYEKATVVPASFVVHGLCVVSLAVKRSSLCWAPNLRWHFADFHKMVPPSKIIFDYTFAYTFAEFLDCGDIYSKEAETSTRNEEDFRKVDFNIIITSTVGRAAPASNGCA